MSVTNCLTVGTNNNDNEKNKKTNLKIVSYSSNVV